MKDKIASWKELIEADNLNAASEFYENKLFGDVISTFCKNEKKYLNQYDVLISLVGFSPEPLILTIMALKPAYIYFLVTDDARNSINKIIDTIGYLPSQYQQNIVESSSSDDVYEQIYSAVKKSKGNLAIDITGGKKAMVGGAAIAAAFLGCDLFYVDFHKYLKNIRKPLPGSEYLNKLTNPYVVFGHLEKEAAVKFYKAGDYAVAIELLKKLIQNLKDDREARILLNVFEFHKYWEDYEFSRAIKCGNNAIENIQRMNIFENILSSIKDRLNILKQIKEGNAALIALNHYEMSRRYVNRQLYNFAVMTLYRTIEKIFTLHLKGKYKLNVSSPDYSIVPNLEKKYVIHARKLYGETARTRLPEKIALMDAALILSCFDDLMIENINLKDLLMQTQHRNNGILAHGDNPNSYKQYQTMKKVFSPILESFSQTYFDLPFAENLRHFSPIPLGDDIK